MSYRPSGDERDKTATDIARWHNTLLILIEALEHEHDTWDGEAREALGMLSYLAAKGVER